MKASSDRKYGTRRTTGSRTRAAGAPDANRQEAVEFWKQNQGKLPEKLGADEFETINAALNFLFSLLRTANRQFKQEGDGGRFGAFTALGAMWMFADLFERPCAELLRLPILHLQNALVALDNNQVLPILKPTPAPGRAPSSELHKALKGQAAATVRLLIKIGMSPKDAQRAVAKQLKKLGVRRERGSGDMTATTVRNWCDEVSSDVGRRGSSALMYDQAFTEEEQKKIAALSQDDARRFALELLSRFVEVVFPELQKT